MKALKITVLFYLTLLLQSSAFGQWELVHLNRIGSQLRLEGDVLNTYCLTLDSAGNDAVLLEWRSLDGELISSEFQLLPENGLWFSGLRDTHVQLGSSWYWVLFGPEATVYLLEQDLISGAIDSISEITYMDVDYISPLTLNLASNGDLVVSGQLSNAESLFGIIDTELNTIYVEQSNLLQGLFFEKFRYYSSYEGKTIYSGNYEDSGGVGSSIYTPVVSMFNEALELQWSNSLGNPDLHDSHGLAIPFDQDSILVFHPYADYLNSTNVLATGNTLWRKVLNDQGEILSERSYMDSLKDVRLTDLEINNERIYVTGQKWSYVGLFNHAFLLVTNLEGDVLNYREMHVDSCFACQSQFGDLEFDSFGNLYGFGISINSDENVVSNWLRKFDCLGNDSTPVLSFNPQGILNQDGSIDVWLENEAFEKHHWIVDGNAIYSDTLHFEDWFSNSINLSIYASYCELEFDTTLTLELAVGIQETSTKDFRFHVTPNPASDLLQVTFNAQKGLSGKLVFINAQGQRVRESGTIAVSSHVPTTISQDVYSLPRGMYLLSFETTEGIQTQKVVLN